MINCRQLVAGFAFSLAAVTPAVAQVSWTDWTAQGTNSASGTLFGGTVGVSYGGTYSFVQTGCGTNFWTVPSTYVSGSVATPPPACDIVALNAGGLKTITFSQAVVNPLIALASWNGQPGTMFSNPIEILSQGPGYWGSGLFTVVNGNTLVGSGEAHGVIRLVGTYTSFSFTDGSENWHGITVGAQEIAQVGVVPEPATYALMTGGLFVLAAVRRRRRSAS